MNLETQYLGRKALVIGASSGIGEACVKGLMADGYQVAMVARRKEALQDLADVSRGQGRGLPFVVDVTDFKAVPAKFKEIVAALGGLDLVIYAAGVMPKIEPGEYDFQKDKEMIDVNLLGAIAWLNEAAQYFARVRKGSIVGISSIAGDRGRRGNPVYATSKAALATYLESLRNRLDMHEVHVLTVKPGMVDTPMTRGMDGLIWLITAEEAARQILRAIEKRRNTVYVPRRWAFVGAIIRCIPSMIFRKLNI